MKLVSSVFLCHFVYTGALHRMAFDSLALAREYFKASRSEGRGRGGGRAIQRAPGVPARSHEARL